MYQVFNMGHRMEIYVRPEMANLIIAISRISISTHKLSVILKKAKRA